MSGLAIIAEHASSSSSRRRLTMQQIESITLDDIPAGCLDIKDVCHWSSIQVL